MSHSLHHLGQLDTALTKTSGGASVSGQQFDYGYDAGWNMTSRATGSGTSTYAVNDRNQATTVAGYSQSYNAPAAPIEWMICRWMRRRRPSSVSSCSWTRCRF